ncbi:MAG: CpsD/CapB family tyrosine-protein kinase [Treponema sp.]|nr:CpsD/CapB family tyrosine-protein kinase [Treponema sp.]
MEKRRNNKIKSILFCGTEPAVGTTTITINLALSLAQGKNKIILIDSDMRKLPEYKRLGETPLFGLSDYLADKSTLNEIINETNIHNLSYITCGLLTGQSAKLLSSNNLEKLVTTLSNYYDFILFDSPSLGAVTDAAVISMLVDGIILVVELGKTMKSNISRSIQNLSGSYNKILGLLVNKVDKPEYRVYLRNYDYFQNSMYIRK